MITRRTFLTMSLAAAAASTLPGKIHAADARAIVVYFSASGVTRRVAGNLAKATGAVLAEIAPEEPYTASDLDWHDKQSRSSIEMRDAEARPAMASTIDLSGYDVIFVGYPIWWAEAPRIINTFLEKSDIAGKTIVPFCTSGGIGLGQSGRHLAKAYPKASWAEGRELRTSTTADELRRWSARFLQQK